MNTRSEYARIPIAAVGALAGDPAADFEIRLPDGSDGVPALYRRSGTTLGLPDFEWMRQHGLAQLCVRAEHLAKCEAIIERKLSSLLHHIDLTPAEKVSIVHQVGCSVARDLTPTNCSSYHLRRASNVVDNVIGCVLGDPLAAGHVLRLAGHERTMAGHMFLVSALAVILGAEICGDDLQMLRAFGFAGMLHDLGKLAISPAILNKPEPLSPEEVQLIEQHPIESVRLLSRDPQATLAVRQMILQHHERVDGKGYPIGVSGTDLLPQSRILAIVDSFHALIGQRPCRDPITPQEANQTLNSLSGTQFDADMLACWNALFERLWVMGTRVPPVGGASAQEEASPRYEHSLTPPPRPMSHRRVKRRRCRGNVYVRCIYAGRLDGATAAPDEFGASVRDATRGGLCLCTPHPTYRGEVLHVQINDGDQKVWVRAVVTWCRQFDASAYRTGLRFRERIEECDIHQKVPVEKLEVDAPRPGDADACRAMPGQARRPARCPSTNQA